MSSLWSRRHAKEALVLAGQPATVARAGTAPPGSLVLPPRSDQGGATSEPSKEFAALYELGESLGAGTVAVVRRAKRLSDGSRCAVKCISSSDDEVREFSRVEFELVHKLRHTGIVRMDYMNDLDPNHLYICMELCEGSIEGYVNERGRFEQSAAQGLFGQLLRAVNYLHRKRIVHRDLKPDNLLLHNQASILKVADFNSAKQIGSSLCSCMLTDRGTRSYSAPELRFGHLWNERVDIWASGLCFYVMLTGRLPFDIQSREVSRVLALGQCPDFSWEGVAENQQNLILQCLTINMRDRPPAMQLLRHSALLRSDGEMSPKLVPKTTLSRSLSIQKEVEAHKAFLISWPRFGLLWIYPLQQQYWSDERYVDVDTKTARGDRSTGLKSFMERRDGALQFQRLADHQFAKVDLGSPKLLAKQKLRKDRIEHRRMEQGYPAKELQYAAQSSEEPEDLEEEPDQPHLREMSRRHFFTRSSLLDLPSCDDWDGDGTPTNG